MPLITFITPTYNRANNLKRLFESMKSQKHNFCWLIVDDGSVDDTENVVHSFVECADFSIIYIKKENGGKHTALNKGIAEINTVLTMIIDSDDRLLPNAVEIIEKSFEKYKSYHKIGSLTFLRCRSNGQAITPLDADETVANYIKFRIKGNRPGDMAEVFFTNVLRRYPFPEFKNEHFLSEDIVWIEIGKQYDSVFLNEAIYECEYLEGGLTANDKPLKFASPLGSMMRGKQLMSRQCGLRENIKGAIIYDCYKLQSEGEVPTVLMLQGWQKFLTWIMWPLGKVFNKKWSNQNEKSSE